LIEDWNLWFCFQIWCFRFNDSGHGFKKLT
jgi:hypothetical protein